ncbi:Serine/threonine-protein phosphatase [Meloidogyne graminicola]|uniref:Serine/threonine-protein phosphatase n=1 Tax=Meloidogyne graminicola TaxID=189291 RepID=A0A8S9ZRM6_9BILA|nr:Serine/threonine-protein phosphatase [Meloidogyne graminicola]
MSYYEDDSNPPAPPVLKPVSGSAKDAEAALVTQNDEPAELQTMHEQEIPDILMFSPAAMAKRAELNETQPSSGLSEGEGKFSNIRLQPPPSMLSNRSNRLQVHGLSPSETRSRTTTMSKSASSAVFNRLDLCEFIRRHLVRGRKAYRYKFGQLQQLVDRAVDSLQQQPSLIETTGPINICGDLHGQYTDLLRIFHSCGPPHKTRYLFLGDFVDRGGNSLEIICLLLACKIQYPKHIFLLRGNHELHHINKVYGFYDELSHRFGPEQAEQLWNDFNDAFAYLPLAALIGGKILCMHGGISPRLKSLNDIRSLKRPISVVITPGLVQDLLWADPNTEKPKPRDWELNPYRNCSVMFSADAVKKMCEKLGVHMFIRAHQAAQYGYSTFANNRLITVFSAVRYNSETNNWGAVAKVSQDLEVSFALFKPKEFVEPQEAKK